MDLLVSASIIASFFAGIAALLAPCCIGVLLPTYFASVFKQRATIFLMTFIYFLGILVVFLPLGLGAAWIAAIFRDYHQIIFTLGGAFLLLLGVLLVTGRYFSLPMVAHPQLKKYDAISIFTLGIFSGIATTCCAPVLAGVIALSAMPGSVFLGLVYTLAYVLGMVTPLFILALVMDKNNFTKKFFTFRRTFSYSVLGRRAIVTYSNFFSGMMFLILGAIVLLYERESSMTSGYSFQITVNIYLTKLIQFVSQFSRILPEWVWAVIFVGLVILLARTALKQWIKFSQKEKESEDEV